MLTAAEDTVDDSARAAYTAPAGEYRRYLAEGIETEQINTRLAIANPGTTDAQAS